MNIHFAAAWLRSILTSPEDALSFYADEFEFNDPPQERYIRHDKAALRRVLRPMSNTDPDNGLGIHRLEVLEYIGDQNSGLVLWKWSASHTRAFFGLQTHGIAVQTTGMSYHLYEHGKIAREIVYSDQIHVVKQLGYPVLISHDPLNNQTPPEDPTRRRLRH